MKDIANDLDSVDRALSEAFDNPDLGVDTSEEVRFHTFEYMRLLSREHPEWKIICDETNNTLQDIENGVVNVTLTPPISLDRIRIDSIVGETKL